MAEFRNNSKIIMSYLLKAIAILKFGTALFVTFFFILTISVRAENVLETWNLLTSETVTLVNAGNLDAAQKKAQEAVEFSEASLPNPSEQLAVAYNNLGAVMNMNDSVEEGLTYTKRGLEMRREIFEAAHPEITASLENLADAYQDLGQYKDAIPLLREALEHHKSRSKSNIGDLINPRHQLAVAISRKGNLNQDELQEVYELTSQNTFERGELSLIVDNAYLLELHLAAEVTRGLNSLELSRFYSLRYLELAKAFYTENNWDLANGYGQLAVTLLRLEDFKGAADALRKAAEISIEVNGEISDATAMFFLRLGETLEEDEEYEGAEQAYRETLNIKRQLYGEEHAETINTYNLLGLLLMKRSNYFVAEQILRKAKSLSEKLNGRNDLDYATVADNHALVLNYLGHSDEAIPIHREVLAIREREYGREADFTSRSMNNLALALESNGNYDEAERLFREALEIDKKTLEPDAWQIESALINLARVLEENGNFESLVEAQKLYGEALEIRRRKYPTGSLQIVRALSPQYRVTLKVDSLAKETQFETISKQLLSDLLEVTEKTAKEMVAAITDPVNRHHLHDNVERLKTATALFMLASPDGNEDAFMAAQWPMQNSASKAIAATTLRIQSGDEALAKLLRNQQDKTEQYENLNQAILASFTTNDAGAASSSRAKLKSLKEEINNLTLEINDKFPNFSEFQGGEAANIKSVSSMLREDEALVFINPGFVVTGGFDVKGSIFVVEANGRLTSKVLEAGTGIQTDAEKLFCSIQHGTRACAEQDQIANNNNNETRGAFSLEQPEASLNLPAFDMELAHNLYQRIFEPVSQVLYSKKKLIIVSSDEALATLPFQLLLLSPHELSDSENSDIGSTYANAPWLIRQWAISVSTSVSAFTASRSQEQEVAETNRKPFLGIGDPVIGTQGEIDCSEFTSIKLAAVSRGLVDVSTQELFPKNEGDLGFADVNAVRRLARLPDTRCELESIATSLEGGDLLLDDEATEAQIKNLDELGKLAEYDIISFATHGLVAGETNLAEPALVLTPPKSGSLQDDGLLTASEVAGLNINAEWVLLSACNTASGTIDTGSGYQENESFAGLARAFFYAGAKSLLVSHWPVQSEAAVELTTQTFQILSEQPDTDRASAFRLAMIAILDDPNATEFTTHPRYWAPFTLLGESR